MQRFLQDIEADTRKRAEKMSSALSANEGERKKLSKEAADAFFMRLQADGERRRKARCAPYLQPPLSSQVQMGFSWLKLATFCLTLCQAPLNYHHRNVYAYALLVDACRL